MSRVYKSGKGRKNASKRPQNGPQAAKAERGVYFPGIPGKMVTGLFRRL
jgi:hypothetical protein